MSKSFPITSVSDGMDIEFARQAAAEGYFPREDVATDALVPVAGRTTHWPYKGDATYWTLAGRGQPIARRYPDHYDQVPAIRDYVALYQDRVDVHARCRERLSDDRAIE